MRYGKREPEQKALEFGPALRVSLPRVWPGAGEGPGPNTDAVHRTRGSAAVPAPSGGAAKARPQTSGNPR